MAKNKGRGEAFYRRLVAAYRRSGKSQRAFAAEQGIPAGTLSHWCHKLKKQEAKRAEIGRASGRSRTRRRTSDSTSSGTRASCVQSSTSRRPAFLPVRVLEPGRPGDRGDRAGGYEIVFAKGVLRLPVDFDPVRVGALLRAAEVAC